MGLDDNESLAADATRNLSEVALPVADVVLPVARAAEMVSTVVKVPLSAVNMTSPVDDVGNYVGSSNHGIILA